MSKTFARSSLCALSMTIMTAHAAEPPTNLDKPEGRLDIIAWPGYIERGQTDKQYDWVTQFEKETGCAVNVKTAATSDEMVSLMTKGGYDLVTASGDASLRLIMGKRVQPINTALIPNWKTLDPRVVKGDWFNVGGKVYGTPYQWGPNLLMYNTKTFPTPPDSWQVVFVEQNLPDGKSNKGRVQAYDGPIYIADAALFVKATQPQLGISDPYQLTEEQYQAVLKVLRAQHSLIHRYWHDTTVQMSDFKNEGVVASSAWPYQANALKAEGQPVATVFPKEGVTGWADTTMLHSEAKHPVCAYKWMNWSLTPKVQGDVAAWFGSLPVVPEGCKASSLLGEKGCETNGFNYFDKIAFWKTPIAEGGKFVPYSRWTQDLKKLQQSLGITFIFVTHDQGEALSMSDRVAVFNNGRIEQVDSPRDLYMRPHTPFVAGFVGTSNVFDGLMAEKLCGMTGSFALRPEHIRLNTPGELQANGTIQAVQYQGAATRFELKLNGGEKLLVSQANMTGEELPATLTPGQQVMVSWSRDVMVPLVEER